MKKIKEANTDQLKEAGMPSKVAESIMSYFNEEIVAEEILDDK